MPILAPACSFTWNTVWVLPGPTANVRWGPLGTLAAGQRAGCKWKALLSHLSSGHSGRAVLLMFTDVFPA